MLLGQLLLEHQIVHPILWYSTPMPREWTRQVEAKAIVFDWMDELSAFAHAAASLLVLEEELLRRADVVFTSGQRLYEAKRHRHSRVYAFPSSVDRDASWPRASKIHYPPNLSSDRAYASMRHLVAEAVGPTMVRGSRGQQVPPMLRLGDSDVRLPDRRGGVRG